eukprot:gene7583-10237_t
MTTTTIRQEDLIESIAGALQYISYYHPTDYIAHLARAYEREKSPAAKDAIAQILTNSRMCAEGYRPICQDTGIVNVFIKWGMDCRLDDTSRSLQDVVDEGVRLAYLNPENKLRASVLTDPAFTRRNTKDNTPCVLHVDMVPGDRVQIDVAAKGGGSENKSKFKMMNPSDSIVDWVLDMLPQMGAGWCPPGMLGIDIALECTGIFSAKAKASMHLTAGAKRVLVSAPSDGADATIVYGVNHKTLTKDHLVVSNGSCTTNCLAPVAKVLNEVVGIETGFMTTIHAYTGDQPTLDTLH